MTPENWSSSVFRVENSKEPAKFGTAFVVHVDATEGEFQTALLVTCAHVVDACTENGGKLKIGEALATPVTNTGHRYGLDLAIIRAELPSAGLRAVTIDLEANPGSRVLAPGCFHATGQRILKPLHGVLGDRLVLDDQRNGWRIPYREIQLDDRSTVAGGYSGSPVLIPERGVCAVLDASRSSSLCMAFPIWQLARILPDMPDELGCRMFGTAYWPILKAVQARSWQWQERHLDRAIQKVLGVDVEPRDFSLWGCALALRPYEGLEDPTRRLCEFVRTLSVLSGCAELLEIVPQPVPQQRTSAGPRDLLEVAPQHDGSRRRQQTPKATEPAPREYRRLIIRIFERRNSSRSEATRGRRYEVQVHTATCSPQAGGCCGRHCIDCAPAAAGKLATEMARTLDETSQSGLREVLQKEIRDILGIFGVQRPDLIQIMAPEEMLPYLMFEAKLDRMCAWGTTQLFDLHPTVFSGQCRSDAHHEGRYLTPKLADATTCWQGSFRYLNPPLDDQSLHQRLSKQDVVGAVTADRDVTRRCLYTPVPIVVVPHDDSAKGVPKAIRETLRDLSKLCLRRLPRAVQEKHHRLSVVYDTPNIPIEFAEAEEPVIVGT